jgi:hypothetical protein
MHAKWRFLPECQVSNQGNPLNPMEIEGRIHFFRGFLEFQDIAEAFQNPRNWAPIQYFLMLHGREGIDQAEHHFQTCTALCCVYGITAYWKEFWKPQEMSF